jgi:integrase
MFSSAREAGHQLGASRSVAYGTNWIGTSFKFLLLNIIYIVELKNSKAQCCVWDMSKATYHAKCALFTVAFHARSNQYSWSSSVDANRLPRFWPAVWALFHGAGLAPSTLKQKLGHIEALYEHTESLGSDLDSSLAALDFDRLGTALEAFFVTLRNVQKPTPTALNRWNTAFHFIRHMSQRLEKNPAFGHRMAEIQERMALLDQLYLGLRPYRKRYGARPRAIPRTVLIEMLDAVQPGSSTNPFKSDATQWRAFVLFNLLLLQGLRRGETLLLKADFLISERDPRSGDWKWRLRVQENKSEVDPRAQRPAIKTAESVRLIPVAAQTAKSFQIYLEGYRGKVDHSYFLSSVRGLPLSLEGVNKTLKRLSDALSPHARTQLFEITGVKVIQPHALRRSRAYEAAACRREHSRSRHDAPAQFLWVVEDLNHAPSLRQSRSRRAPQRYLE